MDDFEDLLTIKQAAKILNVSEMSLRRWTNDGRLACLRIGAHRSRRFKKTDLLNFMEQRDDSSSPKSTVVANTQPKRKTDIQLECMSISYGSHICSLYENTGGQFKLSIPMLLDGLKNGDICFLVATPDIEQKILKELKVAGCDIGNAIEKRQLRITNGEDNKEDMLNLLQTQFAEVTRSGSASMRLVGDMSWAFEKGWEISEIIAYEESYNNTLGHQYPIVSLCQYDTNIFSGTGILNALRCHEDTFNYPVNRFLGTVEHSAHIH